MQPFRPLQRYFDFSGRSGRAEMFQYLGVYIIALTLAFAFDYKRELEQGSDVPILLLIILIGGFIPNQALSVRRLHDRGKSGKIVLGLWVANIIGSTFMALVLADPYADIALLFKVMTSIGTAVSVVIGFYVLVQAFLPGDAGSNAYGPPDHWAPTNKATGVDRYHPSPTVPREVPAPALDDALSAIERLGRLKEQGLLTEDEFAAQKARLLARS